MQLDALLRAHELMRVEWPPLLWAADAELNPVLRMLGEMLALALRHHNDLATLTLSSSNITVEGDPLDGAGVRFAYMRRLEDGGSITIWLSRLATPAQ